MKVLVLCHGNICRSPLSAAVLNMYPGLQVYSAGLGPDAGRGRPACKKIRDLAAKELGVGLSLHRSQQATPELLQWAEVVVYMDGGNLRRLEALLPNGPHAGQEWTPLGSWGSPPVERVQDPAFIRRDDPALLPLVHQIARASTVLARRLLPPKTKLPAMLIAWEQQLMQQ